LDSRRGKLRRLSAARKKPLGARVHLCFYEWQDHSITEINMAKGQMRSNKEAKKPKKAAPAKSPAGSAKK